MRVRAVDDDPAVLDLVAHFLGIATHDNINAAPTSAPNATVRHLVLTHKSGRHARRISARKARTETVHPA